MLIFSLNLQAILNSIFAIQVFDRRYTGMFKKLLALGVAGVAALSAAMIPALACFGYGCGFGCGCGCFSLAGWWGPICGYPWGLFGGPFCW